NKSFVPTSDSKTINIVDVLNYLQHYWKWYLLSILVSTAFFYYQYSISPFVYKRSETVMIKTPENTPASSRVTRSSMYYNTVSVASEILQLKSKELMRQTVAELDASISYVARRVLRDVELYKDSPILVKFKNDRHDDTHTFYVTGIDQNTVELSGFDRTSKNITVKFNTEVETPVGRLTLFANENYTEYFFGTQIKISKNSVNATAGYFLGNLTINQMQDDASLLEISIQDGSSKRADEVITKLIEVYNGITIDDKNQIARNTADFIQRRLTLIEKDLDSVESNIERLKTNNQGIDLATSGEMYLNESRQFQNEKQKIETDIKLAQMMRDYMRTAEREKDLIPNNTGLVDANIETQINEYN